MSAEAGTVEQESAALVSTLKELKSKLSELLKTIRATKEDFANQSSVQDGISFLDVKNNLLLSYVTNLVCVVVRKLESKELQGSSALLRLVHLRVILEKLRPLDKKLKYQVDKLLKADVESDSTTNQDAFADPLSFKPNPANLVPQSGSAAALPGGGIDDVDTEVYRPPKINPTTFDAEEKRTTKTNARQEALRRRVAGSEFLKDIRSEISDLPEESVTGVRQDDATERERERFEEDNFVRLQETKAYKQEKKRKKMSRDSLDKFDDLSDLIGSAGKSRGSGQGPTNGGTDFLGGFVGGRKQRKSTKKRR